MGNPVGTILRAASRRNDEPLNILTFPTHEAQEVNYCKTGHRFWACRTPQVKDWDRAYRPVPDNYVLLNPARGDHQLPQEIDFDLILSQNKFGQYQIARYLSSVLHLPMLSLEHTLPVEHWPKSQMDALRSMRGHVNVFISEFSREKWGWGKDEALVIHHGIDTELFAPNDLLVDRQPHLLSVVNDWVNRDYFCGFRLWQQVTKGLPVKPVGKTPGLSEPAKSVADLVMKYRQADIFLNTSLVSPVPTALLEAMACGCAVVTTSNCMLPEIIEDGINGFISNDPAVLTNRCKQLLSDHALCRQLGDKARKTVLDKFSLSAATAAWDKVFRQTAEVVYRDHSFGNA